LNPIAIGSASKNIKRTLFEWKTKANDEYNSFYWDTVVRSAAVFFQAAVKRLTLFMDTIAEPCTCNSSVGSNKLGVTIF
jgi:hypothetical protein